MLSHLYNLRLFNVMLICKHFHAKYQFSLNSLINNAFNPLKKLMLLMSSCSTK